MERKNTAIVLAAGQGKRMNSRVQKQFLELGGKPVLYYSLNCFQQSPLITDIILVTGAESVAFCKEEIVEKYGLTKVTKVIPGGKERYDSVYEGLLACRDTEYVLIHDGARPFITEEIIRRGIQGENRCLRDRYAFQRYGENSRYTGICCRDTGTKLCLDDSDTPDL